MMPVLHRVVGSLGAALPELAVQPGRHRLAIPLVLLSAYGLSHALDLRGHPDGQLVAAWQAAELMTTGVQDVCRRLQRGSPAGAEAQPGEGQAC